MNSAPQADQHPPRTGSMLPKPLQNMLQLLQSQTFEQRAKQASKNECSVGISELWHLKGH